jgi:hypothetical protein
MKVSIEQIKNNEEFMAFWNAVYAEDFASLAVPTRNVFMEISHEGFISGMAVQRINMQYEIEVIRQQSFTDGQNNILETQSYG